MDYLTLDEFIARFDPLAHLVGGERKRKLVRDALKHAHAHLNAQLSQRYATPLPISTMPSDAQELVRRWVFYLAVRELLAMQGVVINREERSMLADVLDLIDDQIRAYTEGAKVLPVDTKLRVRFGFAALDGE